MTELAGAIQSPYAAHRKVYPREVSGRFATFRIIAVVVLLGLFYGLPWVQWNHRQAILFDLPARKFFLFGLTLFPQDFYLLTWLLIIAALSLFFFTALAGRLWCGYACPQTVWTEIFIWMERLTEGNRSQQIKLDRALWGELSGDHPPDLRSCSEGQVDRSVAAGHVQGGPVHPDQ